MAFIVFVAFENGIYPGYNDCGWEVGMSADLQSRNVRLVATRDIDQPRSDRRSRLQDQIGADEDHPFGFSFEAG